MSIRPLRSRSRPCADRFNSHWIIIVGRPRIADKELFFMAQEKTLTFARLANQKQVLPIHAPLCPNDQILLKMKLTALRDRSNHRFANQQDMPRQGIPPYGINRSRGAYDMPMLSATNARPALASQVVWCLRRSPSYCVSYFQALSVRAEYQISPRIWLRIRIRAGS